MSRKQVKQVKKEPKCSNRNWLIFWLVVGIAIVGTVGVKVYQLNPIETAPTVAAWPSMDGIDTDLNRCRASLNKAYTEGFQAGHDKR